MRKHGFEKREFFFDLSHAFAAHVKRKTRQEREHLFFYRAQLRAVRAEDFQAVAPAQHTLDLVDGVARFVVDIIAVEP